MWVDPSVRRLGVGRMLIEALEDWGRSWDASETILWVYGGNAAAIDFYRDLGFEAIKDGQDAESGARFGALAMRRDIRSSDAELAGDLGAHAARHRGVFAQRHSRTRTGPARPWKGSRCR